MAGEIHDTLAQGLTGIVAQLEALEHAHNRGGDWRRHLDTAAQLARESLSEARRSVRAVGPQALEDARLPDAIAEVARRWSGINGIEAEVMTTGTARPMHPDVEVTLLRAAQEALANVGRHARASRVGLTLSYMEDVVTLDVRDDGVGFTPNGSPGFGLTACGSASSGSTASSRSSPSRAPAPRSARPSRRGRRRDLAADRRRPPGRPRRPARAVHRRRRVRGPRRGGRRPARGRAGRGAPPRRRADGPADAGRRRRDRDPRAVRAPARRSACSCSPPTTPTATCCRRSRRARPASCSRTRRATS